MDIFNRKKVAELEKEVQDLNRLLELVKKERDDAQKRVDYLNETLKDVCVVRDDIPADCKPGEYCRACEFVKTYRFSNMYWVATGYTCGKGQSCKNFVQKEV